MLAGSYEHSVDAKGRIFIPSKFRLDLGMHFYLVSWNGGCIRVYNEEQWAIVLDKLINVPAKSVNAKRRILSTVIEAEMDTQGRVLLPENLRKSAMIFEKAKIVGMGTWMEFWNVERFNQLIEKQDEAEELDMLELIGLA